jgi:hypothetical protein
MSSIRQDDIYVVEPKIKITVPFFSADFDGKRKLDIF